MATKKAPASNTKSTRKARPTPLVLDVTIHYSNYLEQHVAIDAAREKPLAEWTFNDVLDAARQVAHLLPVSNRDAVIRVRSLMWSQYDLETEADSGLLHVLIDSADTHDPRSLTLDIRDFPRAAAIRCVAPSAELMSAARVDEPIVGRAWPADRGCLSVVPGTVRNPYEIAPTLTGDFNKEEKLRRGAKVAAIRAARRAAKLPTLTGAR